MNGLIVTISGTSGIGKGYLKDQLKEHLGLNEPPVYTTRKRREGENRSDRIFVSPKEFQRLAKSKKLVLPQDLYGDKYAFDYGAFTRGGIITEIHPDVARQFKKLFPNAIMIALTTESLDFLRYRLKKRGDFPKEIEKRLAAAMAELAKTKGLGKIFDITYSVDRHNEGQIVAEIKQKLEQIILQKKRILSQNKRKRTKKTKVRKTKRTGRRG